MESDKQRESQETMDFLRDQFDELNKGIKRPHSLDAEVLRFQLDQLDLSAEKPAKIVHWRAFAGMAACFVLVLGAVWAINPTHRIASTADQANDSMIESAEAPPMPTAFSAAAPAAFDPESSSDPYYAVDYTQVRDAVFQLSGGLDSYQPQEQIVYDSLPRSLDGAMGSAPNAGAVPEIGAVPEMAASASNSTARYSATNVQEPGIEEADIVKTDGTYLYSYVLTNTTNASPAIYIADAKNMTLTAKIELDPENPIDAFYIDKTRLVTVGSTSEPVPLPRTTVIEKTDDRLYREIIQHHPDRTATDTRTQSHVSRGVRATVYDISNPAAPKLKQTFGQDGDYIESRMQSGTLYLISNRTLQMDFSNQQTPLSDLIPAVYDSVTGAAKLLPADCIAISPDGNTAAYTVVSALDTRTGKADTQAVLGGSDGVYLSENNLYAYSTHNRNPVESGKSYQQTGIIQFAVEPGSVHLEKTATIDGVVDGQFAFSEYQGNLRIATTAEYLGKGIRNTMVILDRNLQEIGKLEGIAPEERIYSVRYLKDKAYLVTFRQTDPLFVIDLTNPHRPKILGQLKIPGFSEYLHPLAGDLLLGIGRNADANGVLDGLKLSLFDISNPLAPKELHVFHLGRQGSWSEVLDQHRAVLFDEQRHLFAFPAYVTKEADGGAGNDAYYVFHYDREKGFEVKAAITHEGLEGTSFLGVNRGVYIGDLLYTFSPDWIVSYSIDQFTPEKRLRLR